MVKKPEPARDGDNRGPVTRAFVRHSIHAATEALTRSDNAYGILDTAHPDSWDQWHWLAAEYLMAGWVAARDAAHALEESTLKGDHRALHQAFAKAVRALAHSQEVIRLVSKCES